jgi:hypothetical protein
MYVETILDQFTFEANAFRYGGIFALRIITCLVDGQIVYTR